MNVKYDPADTVQVYFKALQYARTTLVYLQETFTDWVLNFQAIDQFNKHMNINEAMN